MSDTDALGLVESASKKRIEVDSLIDAAYKSFQLIEPWNAATSEHPALGPLIKDVKEQGVAYYSALDMSISTAQDGYTFCSDAEFLCDSLLDPNNTLEDVREFLQDMRTIARRSHEAAKGTSELFRSVRQNLNEITKRIPSEVMKVQQQEQHAQGLKAVAEQSSIDGKHIKDVSILGIGAFGAKVAIGVSFPPAVFILPVALCISAFFGATKETRYRREAKERDTEARSHADAMKQLQRAATDLSALVKHVDLFADWWLEMDTMLGAVETKVGQLRADRILRIRVNSIKNGWSEAKGLYLGYKTKISRLQDYYPSSRPSLTAA